MNSQYKGDEKPSYGDRPAQDKPREIVDGRKGAEHPSPLAHIVDWFKRAFVPEIDQPLEPQPEQGESEQTTSKHAVQAPAVGLPPIEVGEPGPEIAPVVVAEKYKDARHVPDTVLDGWENESFVFRAATLRGHQHRYTGAPRQDAFAVLVSEDTNTLFVAVADGVSAAPRSDEGARIASQYAVKWMQQEYRVGEEQQDWQGLLNGIAGSMHARAETSSAEILDYATTLVCAAIHTAGNTAYADILSVGDSGCWTLSRDGISLHDGGKDEAGHYYSSSAVTPLPHVPAEPQSTRINILSDEVLLLGTDGIGDPLGPGGGPLTDLLTERMVGRVPGIIEFGHIVDFSKSGFFDDRTLVAVWPTYAASTDELRASKERDQ